MARIYTRNRQESQINEEIFVFEGNSMKKLLSVIFVSLVIICGLVAQQQNVAPFTMPFAIYATVGSLPASGCPSYAAALVASPLSVYLNNTAGSCTWTQVGAGGSGPYAASQGKTGAISMTGSDVALYTVSGTVPALASGSCYYASLYVLTAVSTTHKLYIDGSAVATFAILGGAGERDNYEFSYCNQIGSQTVQNLTITKSMYCAAFISASTPIFQTPTGVNWASGHTVAIYSNAASGTLTGYEFSWRQ
jgi:hypothetical protein